MSIPFSVDVTTGDVITPGAIVYNYPLSFDNRNISVMAYPLETILAEKLETVIVRDVANTRPRDYYDIYILWKLHGFQCNIDTLSDALIATARVQTKVCRRFGASTREIILMQQT